MDKKSSDVNRLIYQFWTGSNPIPPNRKKCLESNINFGVPTILVTPEKLTEYILPDHPLHPAYPYLSLLHKSDYLRCYFMHFHGGGYADIKFYSKNNNWKASFELLDANPDVMIVGQQETMYGSPYSSLNSDIHLQKLTTCCFFIMRPRTLLTTKWFEKVNRILDEKLEILRRNPAREIRDVSYPLRWAELTGEVLHDVEFYLSYACPSSVNRSLVSGCDFSAVWQ